MVYSMILVVLAAICNACMDTLVHHWDSSVFYKPNCIENNRWNSFFNPEKSSVSAYILPFTKYKVDAWHLLKSLMIILLVGAIVISLASEPPIFNVWWFYLGLFIWFGILWNGTFNIFYNHILLV